MTNKVIRIGTRKSPLAIWQAELVQKALIVQGFRTEIVGIKSEGDIDLVTPLYEMGVQGVFTRAADMALLNNQIDIAVHSLKDVPTRLAVGIVQAAVLPRHSPFDILVYKDNLDFLGTPPREIGMQAQYNAIIGTGSIRRQAQWLHRFPHHKLENLRGNVNTRLQKLHESNWNGAIFAAAGLERIGLRPAKSIDLDWLLPAPAQGAITIVCRETDEALLSACAPLNDSLTAICTHIERDFLRTLMGGCSTPIAALATVENGRVVLKGNICSLDGSKKIDISMQAPLEKAQKLGQLAAKEILDKGADKLIHALTNLAN
jgi:hydroxymethylbilane synthase